MTFLVFVLLNNPVLINYYDNMLLVIKKKRNVQNFKVRVKYLIFLLNKYIIFNC